LAYLLFVEMYLCNDACVRSSYLCELLITGDVGKPLKLLYFITLFHIEFLDCALLDFLAKIGQIEFNKTELKSLTEKKSLGFG
jgi:hypothetical protein